MSGATATVLDRRAPTGANGGGAATGLRVGVDVGGTFTKAVAVDAHGGGLRAHCAVPTTHAAEGGVTVGVAQALRRLLAELDAEGAGAAVGYVAFSTTQAMNALLEGDVAAVGVVGIGVGRELRATGRRTSIGSVKLAAGRHPRTEHELLDASGGLDRGEARAALERLAGRGCEAIAVSGAYAVDDPTRELEVAAAARELGMPSCCGHELSGAYGLETRTVSAAINAAVLPVVERTAGVVESALGEAGIEAPLLVLRGDGGAMSTASFRRRPSFTVGSGPAAGVAAALHQLGVGEAIVLECGGTSSNVSVVRNGRPALRSIRVMGRPTSIRSVDSWVVGAAGGSMARLRRRRIAEVGPRSAHIAELPYACFAPPEELLGGELRVEAVAPRPGDPAEYVCVAVGERRFALTATCAANALGLVPAGSHAYAGGEAVHAAFAALGRRLRRTPEQAARALLDGAVEKVVAAARDARRAHELRQGAPLVALGGAADVLAPEVARRLGVELYRPEHPEVLSSIGAALSLVRSEVVRTATPGAGDAARKAAARQAERECVESGAAPATVSTETRYEPGENTVRAVATGAVELEAGAAARRPLDDRRRLAAAAAALGVEAERLSLLAGNEFYRVYTGEEGDGVAVVDPLGGVPIAERQKGLLVGEGEELLARLDAAVEDAAVNLGVATMLPRVSLICGSRIADLSDARRPEEIVAAARRELAEGDGVAVAVLAG